MFMSASSSSNGGISSSGPPDFTYWNEQDLIGLNQTHAARLLTERNSEVNSSNELLPIDYEEDICSKKQNSDEGSILEICAREKQSGNDMNLEYSNKEEFKKSQGQNLQKDIGKGSESINNDEWNYPMKEEKTNTPYKTAKKKKPKGGKHAILDIKEKEQVMKRVNEIGKKAFVKEVPPKNKKKYMKFINHHLGKTKDKKLRNPGGQIQIHNEIQDEQLKMIYYCFYKEFGLFPNLEKTKEILKYNNPYSGNGGKDTFNGRARIYIKSKIEESNNEMLLKKFKEDFEGERISKGLYLRKDPTEKHLMSKAFQSCFQNEFPEKKHIFMKLSQYDS